MHYNSNTYKYTGNSDFTLSHKNAPSFGNPFFTKNYWENIDTQYNKKNNKQYFSDVKELNVFYHQPDPINPVVYESLSPTYPRNLSTKDIQGAVADSKKSQGVRNKETASKIKNYFENSPQKNIKDSIDIYQNPEFLFLLKIDKLSMLEEDMLTIIDEIQKLKRDIQLKKLEKEILTFKNKVKMANICKTFGFDLNLVNEENLEILEKLKNFKKSPNNSNKYKIEAKNNLTSKSVHFSDEKKSIYDNLDVFNNSEKQVISKKDNDFKESLDKIIENLDDDYSNIMKSKLNSNNIFNDYFENKSLNSNVNKLVIVENQLDSVNSIENTNTVKQFISKPEIEYKNSNNNFTHKRSLSQNDIKLVF